MKRTLLQIVQSILNDMDADEVSSITDTFEAEQVAIIVREAFFNIIDNRDWPHLREFVALDELTGYAANGFTVTDGVTEIIEIRFDKAKTGETRKKYKTLTYLYPDQFLSYVNKRNNDNSNVEVIALTNCDLLIRNDVHPQYWTSFDDYEIYFDAYDSSLYAQTPATRVQCLAYKTPTWVHDDAHIPDLPEDAHTLLLEEAKSTAFYTLKNMFNEKAEDRAKRSDARLARKAFVTKGGVRYPNYGRKGALYNRTPFEKDD